MMMMFSENKATKILLRNKIMSCFAQNNAMTELGCLTDRQQEEDTKDWDPLISTHCMGRLAYVAYFLLGYTLNVYCLYLKQCR
jgi:hypothetical protein